MVNWQITAKTIYCNSVDEEVTIIIKKDWSAQCTGHSEAVNSSSIAATRLKKLSACQGLECPRIVEYIRSLMQEESV